MHSMYMLAAAQPRKTSYSGGGGKPKPPEAKDRQPPSPDDLRSYLETHVIAQQEAIDSIVSIYTICVAGLTFSGRPLGNFLFLGPTGTGKTRIVEAVAEALVNDKKAVIKIDCAEFQHSHEIAKLVGSPPGYLGHKETPPLLTQEVLNRYHTETVKISFVLFDEIEKASYSLWNLLLGILDKATLTIGDNRKVDFSRAMIFMTSNVGAAQISSLVSTNMGFSAGSAHDKRTAADLRKRIKKSVLHAMKKKFPTEFLNRMDKTVVFNLFEKEDLYEILGLELDFLRQLLVGSGRKISFDLTGSAEMFLLSEGTSSEYGARELSRAITRLLRQPIAQWIANEYMDGTGEVVFHFDYEDGSDELFIEKITIDGVEVVLEKSSSPE